MTLATILDGYKKYRQQAKARRLHRQTIRAVSELPQHILRDIGWPNAYDSIERRRSK